MIKTEIILLTNNIINPYQDLSTQHGIKFTELNKVFITQTLAEHGLGFLINIYNIEDPKDEWGAELLYKIIFDTGSNNQTYLYNVDLRGFTLYDVNSIVLSHWHYDHIGALNNILRRIEEKIPVITHENAIFERFFNRSKDLKDPDIKGKKREEIAQLIAEMKVISQTPIIIDEIKSLGGEINFKEDLHVLFKNDEIKVIASGEIPRKHADEDVKKYFSLQEGIIKEDKILDDKCLIIEYKENVVLLLGCCHSGIMNTLDYVKEKIKKPISHIIGGFHMADASDDRIKKTIEYLKSFQEYNKTLHLFPIHCSGDKFIQEINKLSSPKLKAFNASNGTIFNL